jgi:predicted ATPase
VSDLPTGTVTFLFTDIEGSTRLLHEMGAAAYAEALAEHRRVLREAFARHGGVEVDTQGDAFFYAFATVPGAVEAAAEGQRALRSGPIRVRMGVHTGTPHVGKEGYVGTDVHRAARIAAAGHGGQVLLSEATRALVDASALRDLGEHRLKDLSAPERLYQLGEAEFLPLKTLFRTNLPVPPTPFLGREQELRDVVELLQRSDTRLLTLSGPGGTGKTRLALQTAAEAAERFPDGLVWVALAPLRDPALVVAAVAQALELKEEPERPLAETVVDYLSRRRQLLLLDNAEHLLPQAAADIARFLQAPTVTLLITSRERLQLQGEQVWAVQPLVSEDGLALFTARAGALGVPLAASPAVRSLCERLDNLPLALELAAARAMLFTPEQLLERLGQRLDLFKAGRDADPRQQTLRATIGWSHDLLDEDERRLFRRLAVFVGGCTYEAAEAVCEADPDRLQSLLDKSLLRRRDSVLGARCWMLETIREYAEEQLEAAEEGGALRRRHAEHFLRLAERAEPELKRAQQHEWLELLGAEHDNLRAALSWARESGSHDVELRLVGALGRFWYVRGHVSEGRLWVEGALARVGDEPSLARARALTAASYLAALMADVERLAETSDERLQLFRQLGDREGVAEALVDLGRVAFSRGDLDDASSLMESALAVSKESGDRWATALAEMGLTTIALQEGDFERAQVEAKEAVSISREIGVADWIAAALANLGHAKLPEGGLAAKSAYLESLSVCREIGAKEASTWALDGLAAATEAAGDARSAVTLLAAAENVRAAAGIDIDSQPYEAELHARTKGAARRELDESAFQEAFAAGASMSWEDAIDYALGLSAGTEVRRRP